MSFYICPTGKHFEVFNPPNIPTGEAVLVVLSWRPVDSVDLMLLVSQKDHNIFSIFFFLLLVSRRSAEV